MRPSRIVGLVILLAFGHHALAFQTCKNSVLTCSNYCCWANVITQTTEECCSECSRSVDESTRISSDCLYGDMVNVPLIAGIVTVVIFLLIAGGGCIIACVLGCICNKLTGRPRYRGAVHSRPGAEVVTNMPPDAYPRMETQAYPGQPGVAANPMVYGPSAGSGYYPTSPQGIYPVATSQGYTAAGQQLPPTAPPPYTSR